MTIFINELYRFGSLTSKHVKSRKTHGGWLGVYFHKRFGMLTAGWPGCFEVGFLKNAFFPPRPYHHPHQKWIFSMVFYGFAWITAMWPTHKPSPSPIPSSSGRRSRFMATSVKAWKTAGLNGWRYFLKHEIPCARVFSRFFVWVRSDFVKRENSKDWNLTLARFAISKHNMESLQGSF